MLGYSRVLHAVFTLDQTLESVLRGHVEAVDALGGGARILMYDNSKTTALDRVGSVVHFHPRLLDLAGHYHFAPRPCAPARANEASSGSVPGTPMIAHGVWPLRECIRACTAGVTNP